MIYRKDIDFIDQYLRKELKEEQLVLFHKRVENDAEFANEVEIMTALSSQIKSYGRQELRKKLDKIASKNNKGISRGKIVFYWSLAASILLLAGFFIYYYSTSNKLPIGEKFALNTIKPPFINADIEYKNYEIDANTGGLINYKTGTIITIPKDAFIDKYGKIVEGNVDVKYRELSSPEDLFIAGIPMSYDSSGQSVNLQTAGVCELKAYKDDSLVKLNPKQQIKIDFSSKLENQEYCLYSYDTIAKNWMIEKKDTNVVNIEKYDALQSNNVYLPRMANHSKARFKLVFRDPSKFPELICYQNYVFQISENEKNYDPESAKINWKSVDISKDKLTDEYLVTFINPDSQITYKTVAAFEGKNYTAAMLIYNQKIEETKEELLSGQDSSLVQNAYRIKDIQKKLEATNEDYIPAKVFRSFELEKSGLWCYAKKITKPLSGNINASFKDIDGNAINLQYVAVLDKTDNTIFRYSPQEFKSLRFNPSADNAILAITIDGSLAYLKKEDFHKLPKSGNCTVILRQTAQKPETADEIKALIS